MKIKTSIIALVFATVSVHLHAASSTAPAPLPEFMDQQQLAQRNAEKTSARGNITSTTEEEVSQFYTGKPHVENAGGYVYRYRTYNPEMSRWTSADPSGFPDGVNNHIFVNEGPNYLFDSDGLETGTAAAVSLPNTIHSALPVSNNWSFSGLTISQMFRTSRNTISYVPTIDALYNPTDGTWGNPTATFGGMAATTNTLGFTVSVTGNSASLAYTLQFQTITVGDPVLISSTPYVPGVGGSPGKPATATYKFTVKEIVTESNTGAFGLQVAQTVPTTYALKDATVTVTE